MSKTRAVLFAVLNRSVSVTCIVFAASCAVLAPSVATANCSPWNMSGDFSVVQSNGYTPQFYSLVQNGSNLSGSAKYNRGQADTDGTLTGTINGNNFEVTVTWATVPSTIGVYTASMDGGGHLLQGSTHDKLHPWSKATWSSPRTFGCQAPLPTPVIDSVTNLGSGNFKVKGSGFLKSHAVHIRVVNDASLSSKYFRSDSESSGNLDTVITIPAQQAGTVLDFSANDERPGTGVTGTLWSKTFKITS